MLDQLDVLIGLSLVLAGASMIVTLAVQAIVAFLGLRGTNLRWGVQVLLSELDPQNDLEEHSRKIAEAALRHPLVSDSISSTRRWISKLPLVSRWTLATAVRPEELVVVLRRLAAAPSDALTDDVRQKLAKAANAGGLADLRLWFDSTMDRVSQRFTTHTRIATVVGSFLLAFVFRLDVLELQSRLAAEPALRATLVAEAEKAAGQGPEALEAEYVPRALDSVLPSTPADAEARSQIRTAEAAKTYLLNVAAADASLLARFDLALLRERGAAIRGEAVHLSELCVVRWPPNERCPPPSRLCEATGRQLAGMLAAALLLCLGAPFWFNMLKSLVSLRPVLARKTNDEAESK